MSGRRFLALAALAPFALLLLACTDRPPRDREEAPGDASVEQIQTQDGLTLDARLWRRGDDRLVVFLHEFRDDQSTWWPFAAERTDDISALTFDFRGHGASEGALNDVDAMVLDTHAVVDVARAWGFQRIMLVGAGMGAAVALTAAVDIPDVTVVGFSAPADFDSLDTVSIVEHLDDRVQLLAMRDDVSAADSLHKFRALGNIDSTQARLYPGHAHGVDVLQGRSGAEVRARFEELLADFWVPRAG